MSSNNPYAVNGYNNNNPPAQNPYGAANPYGGAGRYNDPYLPQNNASAVSVNSYNSRGERTREERRPPSNPYEQSPQQRPPRQPSPSAPLRPSEQTFLRADSSEPLSATDQRFGQGPRPERRGYGGLGQPTQEYDRSPPAPTPATTAPAQRPPSRPRTADRPQGRERERDPGRSRDNDGDRSRAYSDSRSRERGRAAPDPRDMPPPPSMPTDGFRRYDIPERPAKGLDEILRHIQGNWKSMEGDECVPVKIALQLMDPSSLGLADKEMDFSATHGDLQRSLKTVVNRHYADFNSAVGTYHKIQASIRESQSNVRKLKDDLVGVKGGMLTTRPELRGLAEQSGELDGLLSVLGQMETLREMPGRLEERISEKRWISAVEVLGEALRACRKSELDDIGAISDLRSYFASQESSMVDVLVEELHDHLYLKSPYCVDRWKGQKADGAEKDARETFGGNTWDRPVYQFLSGLDMRAPMVEDASKNPEAETFRYIRMIVEALNKLGFLEETIARIEQRMPVELYRVVDKTNAEIDSKYPDHLREHLNRNKRSLQIPAHDENRSQVLSDLLWTIYAKFEAIAESHRVLHEVILGIVERESIPKPDTFTTGFKELWKLYQMEIRSLLHDYLATDSDMAVGKGKTTTAATDVFAKHHRDKVKRMFKLSNVDEKSPDLKAEEAELDQILKNSVPGLVSKSRTAAGVNGTADRNGNDGTAAGHKLLVEPSVFNMTILLPPSLTFLQHLKDIVPQTSKIPMSTLTSFLDDFLINVFHPQLEEAVTELCTQCMMDIEAFTEDPQWSVHSPHPIFKGASSFMTLVRAFSGMLSSIPQDQMFTQLIITQLVTFYDKCYGFYKAMVSRVSASPANYNANTLTMKAAAAFADAGEIHDVSLQLLDPELNKSRRQQLISTGAQLLISATKASPVQPYDIISDPKSVHQLSLLYNSMQWLSSSLSQLRHVESSNSSHRGHNRRSSQPDHINQRRWTLITNLKVPNSAAQSTSITPVYLPLTPETVVPFDHTLQSLLTLAQKALLTLHLDIRCGILHQLNRALRPVEAAEQQLQSPQSATARESNNNLSATPPPINSGLYPFVLPAPPTSASPRILELNNDLISFDANISAFLGPRERSFILGGLGRLVDRYLVFGADHIVVMNLSGAERMRVDAMVVQQVLRGLGAESASTASRTKNADSDSPSNHASVGLGISSPTEKSQPSPFSPQATDEADSLLTSTAKYYDLFLRGPDAIMSYVKDNKTVPSSSSTATAEATTVQTIDGDSAITTSNNSSKVEYTYDELRTLIELYFSASLRGEDREEAIRARKKMGDLLLELGEVMWDS